MDLKAVVRHYRANHAAKAEAELDSFRREPNLESAVARAAVAETPDRRRYSHQRRLKPADLAEAARVLTGLIDEIQATTSFAKLYSLLEESLVRSRKGLDEMFQYDTALRISAKLNHLPTAVYLHAGTRAGAKALGLEVTGRSLLKSQLPEELRELECHQIEDVLCIYKKYFAREVADLEETGICWLDDIEE
jgi:hypothetical protein